MKFLERMFGNRGKVDNIDSKMGNESNRETGCPKCGGLSYEHDSYFGGYICANCGWETKAVPKGVDEAKIVELRKTVPSANRPKAPPPPPDRSPEHFQKMRGSDRDQSTAVDLPSLPKDVDISKLKKDRLTYDSIERRLSFVGKMSDNERSRLSELSNDKRYKRAIRSLFLRSQGSTKEATWPMLSLQAGLSDKDYVYSNATLAPLKAGHGISFVEYISDALWNYPKFRNNALKILHLVASADAMDRNAATYAKKELADWEEEELHNNIITVTSREGLVEITCPECGARCPSLLSANDPVLETRSWGADCPACGRAFNFKIVVTEPKVASNKDSELVSIFEPKCIKCGSLVKQRISNVLSSLDGMGSATCTRCDQRYTYRISNFKLTLEFETIEASYTGPRKSVCEPVKRISKEEYRQIR